MTYVPNEPNQSSFFDRMTGSQTKYLVLGFLILFLLGQYLEMHTGQTIRQMSGIDVYAITENLEVWRFITYMWFHDHLVFLLVNLSALLVLGTHLEPIWSVARISGYLFFCSLIAGFCSYLLASPQNGLIGATGGIIGLCLLCWRRIPGTKLLNIVQMRQGIWFVGALVVLVHYVMPDHGGDPNGAVAQLGGLLGGWGWFYLTPLAQRYYDKWKRYQHRKRRRERSKLRRRMEELLEKISEHGIDSLSDEERSTLHRASERLDEDVPEE